MKLLLLLFGLRSVFATPAPVQAPQTAPKSGCSVKNQAQCLASQRCTYQEDTGLCLTKDKKSNVVEPQTRICGFQGYKTTFKNSKPIKRFGGIKDACGCNTACLGFEWKFFLKSKQAKNCFCYDGSQGVKKVGFDDNVVSSTAFMKQAKNVILMIVDGMGDEYNTALRDFKYGIWSMDNPAETALDKTFLGRHDSSTLGTFITDSAAAATGFSTGVLANNGVIGVDANFNPRATLAEAAIAKGKAAGVLSTARITHATPASFYAHAKFRSFENLIGTHLYHSNLDLAFGGGKRSLLPKSAGGKRPEDGSVEDINIDETPGKWTVVEKNEDLQKLSLDDLPALGLFSSSHMTYSIDRASKEEADPDWDEPTLSEMAENAVRLLDAKGKRDGNGFFLMVEAARVDHCGHDGDIACLVREMEEAEKTYQMLVDFAKEDGDTTVIILPDHECGGLSLARYHTVLTEDWHKFPMNNFVQDKEDNWKNDVLTNENPVLVQTPGYLKTYPYVWEPHTLEPVKVGAMTLAKKITGVDDAVRVVEEWTTFTLNKEETDLLLDAVRNTPALNPDDQVLAEKNVFGNYWGSRSFLAFAIGEIFAHRAGVTFTTHQHSGADSPISGYGPGTELFLGHYKNIKVNTLLEKLMGVDLEQVTHEIQDSYKHGDFDVCTTEPQKGISSEDALYKAVHELPEGNLRCGTCPGNICD